MISDEEIGAFWDRGIARLYEDIPLRQAAARANFIAKVRADPELQRDISEANEVAALAASGDVAGAERLGLDFERANRARRRCMTTTHLDAPCGPHCLLASGVT